MPDVTKRILTDETGQNIVSALETLCTLVDPNGTAVAAAEKINNMTISVSSIAAGSSPTASVSEVDGHKHIALSIPVELPVVSSQDNGKVMVVKNGAWGSDMMDNATSETAGLMSAEDKQKLDGIEEIDIYKEIEASSNIISFPDGAEAPLEELVIDIEPKQDLHGYSRPWVGGAGKNKLDEATCIKRGYFSPSSALIFTEDNSYLSYETNLPAGSYVFSSDLPNCYIIRYWIDNVRKDVSASKSSQTFTMESAGNFKISIREEPTTDISGITPKSMIEIGSTATAYEPFANICPISGYDTVNVTDHDQDLINHETVVRNKYIATQGDVANSNGGLCYTDYIPVEPGKTYAFGVKSDTASIIQTRSISGYSSSKSFLRRIYEKATQSGSKTNIQDSVPIPDDVHYIRINYYYALDEAVFCRNGYKVYPIAVSLATNGNQTAGTVYSGTVTLLADGSGTITVTHARLAMKDLDDDKFTSSNDDSPIIKVVISAFDYPRKLGTTPDTAFISSEYEWALNGTTSALQANLKNGQCGGQTTNSIIWFCDNRLSSYLTIAEKITAFKSFLSIGYVVYPIATPLTYTLTANQVQTLLGYNYVYTDGAEISLTYVKDTAGLMTTADKIKLNSYPTKLSQFTNDAGYLTSIPVMVGATSSVDGTEGLVPAPATTDVDKFLAGDGTYKSGGLPMVILSYGNSTWSEFINAYRNNVIVYCRASSNSNPASGKQTRMAFMAYVNDADNPTQVEFQYYRSMNPTNKSISQMSDQVFVYTLSSNGTWSVISREASIKSIVFDASSGLTGTYDKNTGTLTITAAT